MATKRTKGGAFERIISTDLSNWWSDDKFSDLCWRTAGSGGRATRRGDKRTVNHYGDIGPSDDSMKPFFSLFCVECKNGYGQWSPYDMLDSIKGYGQLGKWWDKLLATTEKSGAKWPMMVWRRNGKQVMVILPYQASREISPVDLLAEDHIRIKADRRDLVIVPWHHFLVVVDPGRIKFLAGKK